MPKPDVAAARAGQHHQILSLKVVPLKRGRSRGLSRNDSRFCGRVRIGVLFGQGIRRLTREEVK